MPVTLPVVSQSTARRYSDAANDNPLAPAGPDVHHPVLLREALRLFAAHGAGAGDHACRQAERAFFAGRRRDYLHWLAIGRALDRHLIKA